MIGVGLAGVMFAMSAYLGASVSDAAILGGLVQVLAQIQALSRRVEHLETCVRVRMDRKLPGPPWPWPPSSPSLN